jgi:hypothetical protein
MTDGYTNLSHCYCPLLEIPSLVSSSLEASTHVLCECVPRVDFSLANRVPVVTKKLALSELSEHGLRLRPSPREENNVQAAHYLHFHFASFVQGNNAQGAPCLSLPLFIVCSFKIHAQEAEKDSTTKTVVLRGMASIFFFKRNRGRPTLRFLQSIPLLHFSTTYIHSISSKDTSSH